MTCLCLYALKIGSLGMQFDKCCIFHVFCSLHYLVSFGRNNWKMCIVFLYQNNKGDSQYKLILAANRDEYMHRRTHPAEFLPSQQDVLCGLDIEAGNNGTWLGVSKAGKFAALTNVLVSHNQDQSKLSRGHIVMDFLKNAGSPIGYLKSIATKDFREYNVLVGDVNESGKVTTAFYSNCDNKSPRVITNDVVTVACTSLDGNWKKMNRGEEIFRNMLTELVHDTDKAHVSTVLFHSLLSDTTCLYPDPNVKKQAQDKLSDPILEKYCSIKIANLPGYGTRMQTVVLIDQSNEVYFVERSLTQLVHGEEWSEKSYTFKINQSE